MRLNRTSVWEAVAVCVFMMALFGVTSDGLSMRSALRSPSRYDVTIDRFTDRVELGIARLSRKVEQNYDNFNSYIKDINVDEIRKSMRRAVAIATIAPMMFSGIGFNGAYADDELAKFAADGNAVGVDGQCFLNKCSRETTKCMNDPNCLKGLSCLARCKGGSMCSTGCFAKYGSDKLDSLLSCSVEKNDCVHVPKEETGWKSDKLSNLPAQPLEAFNPDSLKGTWYKVMGLDSRYDCFDCQRNKFDVEGKDTLKMEALFRIPRPTAPGFLQNRIAEELHVTKGEKGNLAHFQSEGQMFGLTFWENWYIVGDSKVKAPKLARKEGAVKYGIPTVVADEKPPTVPDFKLVFYTGT